ncbi:restriction endonuclease [Telmatospirillum siberiense]|uniref:Restriction endonuclease n=1 Tax=Telmatospirillum siberiense TaxID=382514 RepID=A0A2N3PQV5_9PROT|nr:restriction endonuclease [Telmatospirillum siberiense]PKU22785.1 restriction endonuclease [Telmatospirillum siberiense]
MITNFATERLRLWLVGLFIKAIRGISKEEDRADVLAWLTRARDIVGTDKPAKAKFTELYAQLNGRKAAQIAFSSVSESVQNYKNSDLPLAVKVAVPLTLLAAPFVGGQGVGIAALGGAIGLPALLLIFVGTAGITAVLESFSGNRDGGGDIGGILELIAHDEILRRTTAAMRKAMRSEPHKAETFEMPAEEEALRLTLLAMDPFDFERHVMGFFSATGMVAWVTKKSNDMGVDGFARHEDGLLVVQCKRNAPANLIGRPAIQQFKGVIEENQALRGYFVTTSAFTAEATRSAKASDKVALVGMDDLVRWHMTPPAFDAP